MDERAERISDPERMAEILAEEAEEHAEMASRMMTLRAEVEHLQDVGDKLTDMIGQSEQRLSRAAVRVWGEHTRGIDTAEALASEVERLRSALDIIADDSCGNEKCGCCRIDAMRARAALEGK